MPESTYEIGRFTGSSAVTGAPLKPGAPFVAALVEVDEAGALTRFDYSERGWESGPRPKRLFASWRACAPGDEASRRPTIDTASLLALFEELEGSVEPRRMTLRYFVTLLLIRRKALVLAGERPHQASDRDAAIVVRSRGTDPDQPAIEVPVPSLDDAALAHTAEQFQQLMGIDS